MILDLENKYHDGQLIEAAATYNGTVVDHGPGVDGTIVADYTILAQVTNQLVGGTSLQLVLETADDEAITSSVTTLLDVTHLTAVLVDGFEIARIRMPHVAQRYSRARLVSLGVHSSTPEGEVFVGVVGEIQRGEPTS
jgi:hypothetical protein